MDKVPCTPSIGADVEWFLYNTEQKEIVPVCGLVGGTKEEPLDLDDGYAVQEDNVMVEWNIPPATRWDSFYHYVQEGIDRVQNHIQFRVGPEYKMRCQHEHTFTPLQLQSDQAKTFGCEPDFDAYLGGVQRPDGAGAVLRNTRTCGGHIHIGGDFQCPDFVAALFTEFYIGVLARLPIDYKSVRQRWYGQPGIFRSKPYGIEYRTPDNQWTSSNTSIELVSLYGHKVAEFLTETSATELQMMFRRFPWVTLREYMSGVKRTVQIRQDLIEKATHLGFQL